MIENQVNDFFMPAIFTSDIFTTVEVEVNTNCNRRCGYCPNGVLGPQSPPQFMDETIFAQLLNNLQRLDFRGRISYHFYNEPLLRNDLEELINQTKKQLPAAHPVLFTNGDLLTEERYLSLCKSGVEYFVVSAHGHQEHPSRPRQTVLNPTKLELTNRGGIIPFLPTATEQILRNPCFAPSEMLIVTVSGDILLCYEDARKKFVMGNIMDKSIEAIWMGNQFVSLRRLLSEGKRAESVDICKVCNNLAHVHPGTSHLP